MYPSVIHGMDHSVAVSPPWSMDGSFRGCIPPWSMDGSFHGCIPPWSMGWLSPWLQPRRFRSPSDPKRLKCDKIFVFLLNTALAVSVSAPLSCKTPWASSCSRRVSTPGMLMSPSGGSFLLSPSLRTWILSSRRSRRAPSAQTPPGSGRSPPEPAPRSSEKPSGNQRW